MEGHPGPGEGRNEVRTRQNPRENSYLSYDFRRSNNLLLQPANGVALGRSLVSLHLYGSIHFWPGSLRVPQASIYDHIGNRADLFLLVAHPIINHGAGLACLQKRLRFGCVANVSYLSFSLVANDPFAKVKKLPLNEFKREGNCFPMITWWFGSRYIGIPARLPAPGAVFSCGLSAGTSIPD